MWPARSAPVRIGIRLCLLLIVFLVAAAARAAPTITGQPAAFNFALLGSEIHLRVIASGDEELTYQWRKYGEPIAGATMSTLALANVATADAGLYDVLVQDRNGMVVSQGSRVEVRPQSYPRLVRPGANFTARLETRANAWAVATLADGGFYVAGDFTTVSGIERTMVARFRPGGALDVAFAPEILLDYVRVIAVQPDGKLVIGGSFYDVDGESRRSIARLNTDGTLDREFRVGSGAHGQVYAIVVQPDGKIVIGGTFNRYDSRTANLLARLNPDGSNDATFDVGSGFDWGYNRMVAAIALQADGKILVGGDFTSYKGVFRKGLARLHADGTLDAAFADGAGFGPGSFSGVRALAVQPGGKVIAGGDFTSYGGEPRNRLVRLDPEGRLDPSFNSGAGFDDRVNAVAVTPDGRILVGGAFRTYGGAACSRLARLTPDGAVDATFRTGDAANGTVNSVAIWPDGGVLACGQFDTFSGTTRVGLVRLDAIGAVDPIVNAGVGGKASDVMTMIPAPGGKWLLGGLFDLVDGQPRALLARVNGDGTLDPTFNAGNGFGPKTEGDRVAALAVQGDGKVIVGGRFSAVAGETRNNLVRLLANGHLDPTFTVDSGCNGEVRAVALQADGRIVVGGGFTAYNGNPSGRILRIRKDGTWDPEFSTGTGFAGEVHALTVQADGKIVAGGYFSGFNGMPQHGLARLNGNGTNDDGFKPATNPGFTAYALALHPDGRILAGGYDSSGHTRTSVLQLERDGSADPDFRLGSCNGTVYALLVQADGGIVIAGNFTTFDAVERPFFLRLQADGRLDPFFAAPSAILRTFVSPRALHCTAEGFMIAGIGFFQFSERVLFGAMQLEPIVAAPPLPAPVASAAIVPGETARLAAGIEGTGLTFSWIRDGRIQAQDSGAAGTSTLTVREFGPTDVGLYTVEVSNEGASVTSPPISVGLATAEKVTGAASEVGANIIHPNGNIYDQILLGGAAAAITADTGEVVRMSFIDLSDDIVQVEFAGPGTLSLVLEGGSEPEAPKNYVQPEVKYVRGHAGIVIVDANADTHVSVFSVGRANAVNQGLFRSEVTYDGLADIAYLAIASVDGRFGSVRTGNASFWATRGLTGIYAPGVSFAGPVVVGDVNASDAAMPALVFGGTSEVKIAGGDLTQPNHQPLRIAGVTRLSLVAGTTSHGILLPAQTNQARIEEDGVDVTSAILAVPGP